jgi:hypothetical protein
VVGRDGCGLVAKLGINLLGLALSCGPGNNGKGV